MRKIYSFNLSWREPNNIKTTKHPKRKKMKIYTDQKRKKWVKWKKRILGSENFTPGAAHFRPLNLNLFPSYRNSHSLIILIIFPIIVIHAPDKFILRLFIGFGWFVAELKLLIQMCRRLVLGVLLKAWSQYDLTDVLVFG